MSARQATYSWKGRRLRLALYTVGILVAITIAGLVRTSPTRTTAAHAKPRATASLTDVNALTIAPIADQTSNVGIPVVPISPSVAFAQPAPDSVVTWGAVGLPPGISFSGTTGLFSGTPTTTGTYPVAVYASADTRPPLTASQAFTWSVTDRAPQVARVSPAVGAGGMRTVITGTNFLGATSVHFGSVPAPGFTVNKHGTAIVVRVPAARPGVVDVTVTSAVGTRSPVATDRFTYVAPTITAISTHAGPVAGGTRVRITGSGLAGATVVRFGNVPSRAFAVHHSGTLVTAIAPAGSAGTVQIEIVTPGGTVSTGGRTGFTYRAHA